MAESGPVESSNLMYEKCLAVLAMSLSPHLPQNCKINVGHKNKMIKFLFSMCMERDTQ